MTRLALEFTPRFKRDYKAMAKHRDVGLLREVFELIARNDLAAREELRRRHGMHRLSGRWSGSNECHVCNVGDWLLVWAVRDGVAVLQRTGTHGQIFGGQ